MRSPRGCLRWDELQAPLGETRAGEYDGEEVITYHVALGTVRNDVKLQTLHGTFYDCPRRSE